MIKRNSILFILFSFIVSISPIAGQSNIDHKYKEFDFWIGEWDVYKQGTDSIVGKSKIESIIDGKVIKETYRSTRKAYHGTSLNIYNQREDRWEQFWVDNSGLTLHILGNLEDGKMVLQNEITSEKDSLSNKISWQKNNNNTVRQTWSQSTDQGKTWNIVFDGEYRKRGKQSTESK